jgi:hypothetical protein
VHIKGPIDEGRFERAAAQLLEMHGVLSARIGTSDHGPIQYYGNKKIPFEAVRATSPDDVDVIFSNNADSPFDVFNNCPLRIVLALTGNDEAYLLVVGHHIFFDAVGLRIIFKDYLDLCFADSPHLASPPTEDPERSFFTYVSRQAEMFGDGSYEPKVGYWLEQLSQADPELRLIDRQADRSTTPQSESPVLQFWLDDDTCRRYFERARHLRVTPFSLASSAMFEALRQNTDQKELLLGVAADTRRKPFERTAGNFIDMFLLRQKEQESGMTDIAVRQNFQNIMRAVKNYVPHYYFMDRLPWLQERIMSGAAMCDVYIDYIPRSPFYRPASVRNRDIEIEWFPLHFRSDSADQPSNGWVIALLAEPYENGIWGRIEYKPSVLSESDVNGILAAWTEAITRS